MGEGFSCSWLPEEKCPHKKCEHHLPLNRCWKCEQHRKFMREMEEEDGRVMDEIERIRSTGEW